MWRAGLADPDPAMNRTSVGTLLKKALIRLGLIVSASCLTLVAVNLALSLTGSGSSTQFRTDWQVSGPYQLDPELIYSLRPGSRGFWQTSEFTEVVEVNSFGLRNEALRDPKDYQTRIIVTGDSMVFGHGVMGHESFPKRLQELAEADGLKWDVVNAGVKGYGTDQSFRFFQSRLVGLKPDVLVFCINANDVGDNIRAPLFTIADDDLAPLAATHNSLYVVLWLQAHLPTSWSGSALFRVLAPRILNIDLFRSRPRSGTESLTAWSQRKIELEISRLDALSKDNGFKLFVMLMPLRKNPYEYDWLGRTAAVTVPIFDANADPEWRRPRGTLFFKDSMHLTVEGNLKLARMLFGFLAPRITR